MPQNVFDQASRYLAKLDPVGFLCWLLGLLPDALVFRRWLDTRLIPFPGEPDRFCDTVAHVEDVLRGQLPWAIILEFQIEPDALLFGRAISYGGQVWVECKPSDERGDRFELGVIIVNLTGRGRTGRTMSWPEAGLLTVMQPREISLCDVEAKVTLHGIAAGRVSPGVLALIPLMQGGGDSAIIPQWLTLASAVPDARRRGDLGGLALVFAEATGCQQVWKDALRGWNMKQSQQVLEWQEEARAEERASMVLRTLRLRFGPVPVELESAIRATTDLGKLDRWIDAAIISPDLSQFRSTVQL